MPVITIYIQNHFEKSNQVNWERNDGVVCDFYTYESQETQAKKLRYVGNVLERS